jgi:hypothetical protein
MLRMGYFFYPFFFALGVDIKCGRHERESEKKYAPHLRS